jgi:hypothetical protein
MELYKHSHKKEILTFIISMIFYINVYELLNKKVYYNVIHSLIFSICTVYALFMENNSSNLDLFFYKLVLIHEIGYNVSDIILNTKKTNGKYFNHHVYVLIIIIVSLVTKVEEKLVFYCIGIVQIGNIFYHMARLKIIDNKYSFLFYTLSNIITFVYVFNNINYNFLMEDNYLIYTIIYFFVILVGLWRLNESSKMYKLLNN